MNYEVHVLNSAVAGSLPLCCERLSTSGDTQSTLKLIDYQLIWFFLVSISIWHCWKYTWLFRLLESILLLFVNGSLPSKIKEEMHKERPLLRYKDVCRVSMKDFSVDVDYWEKIADNRIMETDNMLWYI